MEWIIVIIVLFLLLGEYGKSSTKAPEDAHSQKVKKLDKPRFECRECDWQGYDTQRFGECPNCKHHTLYKYEYSEDLMRCQDCAWEGLPDQVLCEESDTGGKEFLCPKCRRDDLTIKGWWIESKLDEEWAEEEKLLDEILTELDQKLEVRAKWAKGEKPESFWSFKYYRTWYLHLSEEDRACYKTYLENLNYGEYLKTPHWQIIRKECLDICENRCMGCGSENNSLHVHHKSYRHRGEPHEEVIDLKALCRDCHKLEHGKI